jgi:DnaJ-class molecular chaperone
MSDFWKEVRKAFGTYDVYEIFGVDKDDVDFDTKLSNAHHRISRSLRPNKKRARNSAQKFEVFEAIYKILSDKDARALLENGGRVDENWTVQLDLQDFDRPICMVLRMSSHGTKRHHFLQALQFYFNSEDRYVSIGSFFSILKTKLI